MSNVENLFDVCHAGASLYFFILIIYWFIYGFNDEPNFELKQTEIHYRQFSPYALKAFRRDVSQEYFKCCGWKGPQDYFVKNKNFLSIPKSCCKNKQNCNSLNDIFTDGCVKVIVPFLQTNSRKKEL